MIWGKVLHPGEPCTEIVESEVHLSMASIECRPRIATRKDNTAHVVLKTSSGEYLLCSLGYGPTPQQNLDLVLQPHEQITFMVEGSGVVHLTGYTTPQAESVGYYGDGEFDEGTFEEVGAVPQEDNNFNQEFDIGVSEEQDFISVKTEEEPPKDDFEDNTNNVSATEDLQGSALVAVYDNRIHKNRPTSRTITMEQPAHEVDDLVTVVKIDSAAGDDCSVGDDGEGIQEASVTDSAWTGIKEPTSAHYRHAGTSHQHIQRCVTCSNFIPYDEQIDNGQLATSNLGHCQTCLQRLQGSRENYQQSNRRIALSEARSKQSPQSRNALHSGSPDRGMGGVHGGNHYLPEHHNLPEKKRQRKRQRTVNKDRLYSFYCSYCHKAFASQAVLKVHKRTHTGEKPYKCRFCPKAFTQCTNWKSHEKTHTGEKPFKCSYCEKTFIRSDSVRNHERTHTGEKPYQCQKCPRAFGQRGLLRKHELLHQT